MNEFDLGTAKPMGEELDDGGKDEGFDLGSAKPAGIDVANPNGNPPPDDTFLGTLRNPWELWTKESLPAHAISAYQKGVFDKPIGELVHNAGEAVKDFSASELWDAAKKHPGKFAGELVNSVVADPYLLLAPMGLGGKLAESLGAVGLKVGQTAGKLAGTAGRIAEAGVAGAALEAPISAAKQLDEAGFIDPAKFAQDTGMGGAFAAATVGILHLAGMMGKTRPADIAANVQEKMAEGANPLRATEEALRESGLSGKKARELTDALEPYRDENALEAAAAKERIAMGEAQPGTEPSALAAREEFLNAKRSLTPSQAKDLADIKHYREILPELDVDPAVADVMTPKEAQAIIEERVPDAPLETFVKAEAPKVLEEGKIGPEFHQRGFMDPTLAKYAGLTLTGAAIGGYLADDKAKGAALGAALFLGGPVAARAAMKIAGAGVERVKTSALAQKVSSVLEKRNPEITGQVDNILRGHEGTVATGGLEGMRIKHAIKSLVPDEARRAELIHAIQEGRVADLAPNERAAAEAYQKQMAELGDWAQKEGVLDDLISDGTYVTQLWEDGAKAQGLFNAAGDASRFAEDRLIPSYKMGMDLGLKPKTLDLGEIAEIYGKSISKSVANKNLLETLGSETLADGKRAVVSAGEWVNMTPKDRAAYSDFVPVNHPQLFGAKVHPELAPSLSHFFHSTEIPAYVRAAAAISAVAKRGIFMLSGFHVKSLADEALGISLGLLDKNAIAKIPSMYKMIKEGKAGDFASQMVRDGLKIEPHSGVDMDNDIFRSIAKSTEAIARDLPIPGAHLPIKALNELDKGIQFATWEYFHPAVKMSVASSMMEKALLSGDSRAPQVIRREIAGVVNDLFGGINWRQTADGVENKLLSSIAHSLANPNGLRILRILMTAPDWSVATLRAGVKGAKSTIKGVTGQKLKLEEKMYMRAFLGNAVAYATIAEGLNLAFSGHHFWENKDPTYVDMGDGRKLQLNKHFMEPIHDLMDPANAIVNKAGYLPKEIAEQIFSKEYLTAKRGEKGRTFVGPEMKHPSIPGRIGHAVKGMVPIPLQQSDIGPAISGSMGLPIYGKTDRQKRIEKREKEVEQRQQSRERELTKRREKRR